uniref:Reverse transcriptase domain-containing protein n=1 Tax=Labrus bergylta TaxID=56723 RepID=A0A3Q3EJ58_9LABR
MGFQTRRKKQETEKKLKLEALLKEVEEINIAILQMAPGKSPRMDGLPQEFYSKFQHKLTTLLLAHYSEVFLTGAFSTFSNTASIILLPKKDKDPLICGSKRPLSILNCDIKILSKVLANRLVSLIKAQNAQK